MAKSRYVLVLSGGIAEGNTYAKRAGLERFSYRAIGSAKQVRNIQVADVHVLPSFHRRPDRHAIMSELRWGRDIKIKNVEMPPAPPREGEDRYGEQLTIDDVLREQEEFARRQVEEPDVIEMQGREVDQSLEDKDWDLLEAAYAHQPSESLF